MVEWRGDVSGGENCVDGFVRRRRRNDLVGMSDDGIVGGGCGMVRVCENVSDGGV